MSRMAKIDVRSGAGTDQHIMPSSPSASGAAVDDEGSPDPDLAGGAPAVCDMAGGAENCSCRMFAVAFGSRCACPSFGRTEIAFRGLLFVGTIAASRLTVDEADGFLSKPFSGTPSDKAEFANTGANCSRDPPAL
jgi:hypothetical protein